jgi:cysteine desulfurase/selenocysteine lyase
MSAVLGPAKAVAGGPYDVAEVRRDFPALHQSVRGKPLVYLDNGATTQKPRAVIEAEVGFYERDCANVHRGVHTLSERATRAFDEAREAARRFVNARSVREVVFVRGATEAINLVAQSYCRERVGEGDEILITELEHHANIVPWQLVCQQTGAVLKVVPISDAGEVDLEALERMLGPRTRIFAVAHVSNALGTVNPVRAMVKAAHAKGVPVLVDGAQAAPHIRIDVQDLDCDFYVFSGHKVYGPTGIGVLYGREALLEEMPPYQGGGEMIRRVTFERSQYAPLPLKFEAGTPNVAGAIGLRAALEYVIGLGLARIAAYEHALLEQATAALATVPGLRIVGTAREKASLVSFVLEGVHPHDVGTILDHQGIAVRTGHHCAMPVMDHFCVPATTRASFGLYNTGEEVDALVAGLHKVREVLGR